jgi:hypothetical protein
MIVISSIDRARRRILVTASGRITAKDMLAHIKQEQDDGLLSFSELVDARGAQPAFSPADLRVVVDLIRRLAQDSAVGAAAIIVSSELAFGMLRILEMMVEDVCLIRPFRRPEDAEASLPDPSSS